MTDYLIKNVAVLGGTPTDLMLRDGAISATYDDTAGAEVIDATGLIALPGLVDLHTHLREPGREDAETVETGVSGHSLVFGSRTCTRDLMRSGNTGHPPGSNCSRTTSRAQPSSTVRPLGLSLPIWISATSWTGIQDHQCWRRGARGHRWTPPLCCRKVFRATG